MAFVEGGFTNGGNGLMKSILREMLASGFWTIQESIANRGGELAAVTVAQNHTRAVSVSVAGIAVNTDIHLPICMIGAAYTARKNFGTAAVLGTDFTLDRVRGTIQILTGGIFAAGGVGIAATNFTLYDNYELMRGWVVLHSTGISTTENLYVGLEFDTIANASPANPVKSGASVAVFASWVNGTTSYSGAPIAVRNKLTDDVLFFTKPNIEGTYEANISADRVLAFGEADALGAWVFAGALTRIRPAVEQACIIALMGSTAGADVDDDGPVGDTNSPGVFDAQQGSAYLYDQSRFADVSLPVELNAHRWTLDSASIAAGAAFTPSQAVLNTASPGFTPQYYFELHDVIVGRNVDAINSATSVIYGAVDGLKVPLVFDARHNLEVTLEGVTYRLWRVGSNPLRFVAVTKV